MVPFPQKEKNMLERRVYKAFKSVQHIKKVYQELDKGY